jgi:hypothetical protein
MLFDKYITFDQKIIIAVLSAAIWIYFRNWGCYKLIPRKSTFSVIFVGIWLYLNYYEPLVVPIGLSILVLYSLLNKKKNFKL